MPKVRSVISHKTSLQGLREDNEDVELINMNLLPKNNKYAPVDLFIVCDGHGGKSVAQYAAPTLEKYIMHHNNKFPLSKNKVIKIYDAIQNKLENNRNGIADACGCTALVIIRYLDSNNNENIQVINIGDCRAVLNRNGLAIPLSKDHKPIWPDEKKRIDRVNHKHDFEREIHFDHGDWRIGDLSVSRAFGDIDNTPHVNHIPDIFNYVLESDDEFIVMACDGVWDVLENHEVINFIKDHKEKNNIEFYDIPGKYPNQEVYESKNIARKLASYAIAKGSTDNVSVIIIFFIN
ncbi:phosphatase 2c [Acanthamoeba polyphaga mimivirus]|uniref:Phosphatase 2c n=1 Tax=Acanthamoeba polyphaga mimivirus TaxID=212035 RepID=A0A2L2DJJ8_MIMIV|nr:phosphatase 2c [Acanthamoeba polyphaga mimivirus]